ncbi:MAG TPA: hypothetical protein VMV70_00740 [Gallionella sp.]|nr:hypothetical protein [Gallionella sp.]
MIVDLISIALIPPLIVPVLIAGIVLTAFLAQMSGVFNWHVLIERRMMMIRYFAIDCSGPEIDHLWWRKNTDVQQIIETGLTATDRDTSIGSMDRCADGGNGERRCDQKPFHIVLRLLEKPCLKSY